MSYSDKVIDHYNNPRNVGSMDKKDSDVGTGLVGAPECGDVMKLQIKVNPQTNIIEDAREVTEEVIPGRRASRARVVAAGLTDDDIDRLIKQAQSEVEPKLG